VRRVSRSTTKLDLTGLSVPLRSLLLDPGSLTRRLKALSKVQFKVAVASERWDAMTGAEARRLGMRPGQRAWIREVTLHCDGHAVVYARSIIPASTYRACYARLGRLGTRPLGELLFRDRASRRADMTVFRLRPGSALYERARRFGGVPAPAYWGRQSVFRFRGRPLLVSEIFLRGSLP
jgi:chorismate--pyruvate lyase